jgi:hypothetical protein
VSEALLSLSGNDAANRGYRRNAATSENGKVVFTDLPPGSYFLRPAHKEFSFEPESIDLSVAAGKTREVAAPPHPSLSLWPRLHSKDSQAWSRMLRWKKPLRIGGSACNECKAQRTQPGTGPLLEAGHLQTCGASPTHPPAVLCCALRWRSQASG